MQEHEKVTQPSVTIIVALFLHPGQGAAFRRFETQAAQIMRQHGGYIERVIRPTASLPETALPDEIHVVCFPSTEAFERYRADPKLDALAGAREAAIARTEMVIGHPGEPYV